MISYPDAINNGMLDKCQMRDSIIEFFVANCNNKLNKNHQYINYYIKRDCKHILQYIELLCVGTELADKSIAQKYYHIYHGLPFNNLPTETFINFKCGYRKGKQSRIPAKSLKYLQQQLNALQIKNITWLPISTCREELIHMLRRVAYTELIQSSVIHNALIQTPHIIDNTTTLLSLIHNGDIYCSCGNIKKYTTMLHLKQTCGKKQCIGKILQYHGRNRNMYYLQTEKIKQKRVCSRKTYRHSQITKDKIRQTNKQTWSPEKKQYHVQQNIIKGVYDRVATTLRKKIESGEYTPVHKNRYNHKRLTSQITGINTYRSSWEVVFHEAHPWLEYETIRIPYTFNGKEHIYIIDFYDSITKTVYEVKPKSLLSDDRVVAKLKALKNWCSEHNTNYKIITEENLYESH